jgi:REP element-mobilizing transposase RayT
MHHRIFLHVVWTTRDRAPTIDAKTARFLEQYLEAVLRSERSELIAIGMVQTHVHLLVRVHPTTELPRLLQRLKGGSAQIGTRQRLGDDGGLRWAKGYSMQSVSARALDVVREYVLNQERRHPQEAIDGWVQAARGG